MSDDKLAFLDKPRDGAGRFAPKETAAPELPMLEAEKPQEPAPQAQQEPVAPAAPPQTPIKEPLPPGHVPLEALLDTREKAQRAQREAEEYKRKYEEATRKPTTPIDPIADPDGFNRTWEEQRAKDRQDMQFETSWFAAQAQHGEAAVQEAEKWLEQELQSNPGFFQTIARQRHPYDFVVKQHKRSLSVAKLGEDDFETAARKWAEANGYQTQQQQQPAATEAATPIPQQRTPLPRPSLANAPSAGGAAPKIPVGDGVAFGAVFKS